MAQVMNDTIPANILMQSLDYSPQSIAIFDTEMKYISANQRWLEGYNLEKQEIIGKDFYEVSPRSPQRWKDSMQRCLQGEVLREEADPLQRAKGHTDYIKWEIHPWYASEETVGGLIMYTEVVTEKVKAENNLRKSEALFRTLFEQSGDAFLLIRDGEFVDCNQATLDMMRTTNKADALKPPPEVSPEYQPDGQLSTEKATQMIETALDKGYHRFDWVHTRADGEDFWAEVALTTIPDPDGKSDMIFTTWRDVTKRVQAENSLRKSEALFRTLFEQSGDAFLLIRDGEFVDCNQATLDMLRTTNKADALKPPPEVSPEYQPDGQLSTEKATKMIETALDKGYHRFDWVHTRADGEDFWAEVALTIIPDPDGESDMIFTTWRDVTQRVEAQEKLAETIRELNESLLFKDQFLATMSHELRTPLNAIMGYSSIALQFPNLDAKPLRMFERIKVNSDRLIGLINDILDISRINAKRIEIVQDPFDLSALANGWYEDFKKQVSDKKLEFKYNYDNTLPTQVVGDEERITQITSNLLTNAIKFTDEGSVSLTVRRSPNTEEQIEIVVADTGIGISETWHHLIFEEFRQVQMGSDRHYGGAGLGLSIVQKLCILMDGNVTLESTPNIGTTFTVTLPIKMA